MSASAGSQGAKGRMGQPSLPLSHSNYILVAAAWLCILISTFSVREE
jgi:hypothetical protein